MALSMIRILMVLSVAAVMAAMLAAMAVPALAQPHDPFDTRYPGKSGVRLQECETTHHVGHGTVVFHPSGAAPGLTGTCDFYRNPNL